jgi:hypothetical protein
MVRVHGLENGLNEMDDDIDNVKAYDRVDGTFMSPASMNAALKGREN